MSILALLGSLLLPTALGGGVLLMVSGRPVGLWAWLWLAGEGLMLGLLLVAGLMMLPGLRPADSFVLLSVPVALMAAVALALGWRRRAPAFPQTVVGPAEPALALLALGLVALHALPLWNEALRLPTLPWDAWSTWMFKARAWFEQPSFLPFVDPATAVALPEQAALATLAPHYPNAVPRFAVWVSSAQGEWSGAAVRLLWPALWLALGAICCGGLRRLGLGIAGSALATAALLSLPLVNHHVALAGYADLWLATLLVMSALRFAAYLRERQPSDALLALAFALLLPTIKLEGAVWLLGLALAFALMLLPSILRWPLVVLGATGLMTAAALWGVSLPVPGLGQVSLAWGEVRIPGVGQLELYWRPVGDQVLAALFQLPNWHLLWFVWPVLVGWRLPALRADPAASGLGWFLAYAGTFLFVLFFFTDASRWAENLTSVNRVLMQVVPVAVVFAALGFSASRPDDDRSR